MASIEEKVEDIFKRRLDDLGVRRWGKAEAVNPEIKAALESADSKSGGAGGNFPDIQALLDNGRGRRIPVMMEAKGAKNKLEKLDKFRLEDDVTKRFPAEIKRTEDMIASIRADMDTLAKHPHPADGFAGMKIHGRDYLERGKAGEALLDAIVSVADAEPVEIGSYRGFGIYAQLTVLGDHKTTFKGNITYTVDLGSSATGNIARIDNALARLPEYLEEYRAKLADLKQQLESARAEATKPFALEAELQRKSARLAELDAALNLGHRGGEDVAA